MSSKSFAAVIARFRLYLGIGLATRASDETNVFISLHCPVHRRLGTALVAEPSVGCPDRRSSRAFARGPDRQRQPETSTFCRRQDQQFRRSDSTGTRESRRTNSPAQI